MTNIGAIVRGGFARNVRLWKSIALTSAINWMSKMDWCLIHTDQEHESHMNLSLLEVANEVTPFRKFFVYIRPHLLSLLFRYLTTS